MLRAQAEVRRPGFPSLAADPLCNSKPDLASLGLGFLTSGVLSHCFTHYHHQNDQPHSHGEGLNSVMGPSGKDIRDLGFH